MPPAISTAQPNWAALTAYGTVFELTPTAGGGWTEKVLHSFGNGTDGTRPYAGLIFDAAGNLYGTTTEGGTYRDGTVFELTPTAGGGWTETVLHSFNFNGTDGVLPNAGLIFDATGNLYGTTYYGGAGGGCQPDGCGTVFELTPTADGGWTEQVLFSFNVHGRGYPRGRPDLRCRRQSLRHDLRRRRLRQRDGVRVDA